MHTYWHAICICLHIYKRTFISLSTHGECILFNLSIFIHSFIRLPIHACIQFTVLATYYLRYTHKNTTTITIYAATTAVSILAPPSWQQQQQQEKQQSLSTLMDILQIACFVPQLPTHIHIYTHAYMYICISSMTHWRMLALKCRYSHERRKSTPQIDILCIPRR